METYLDKLADEFSERYIVNYTNIPMDSPKYRALVNDFKAFGETIIIDAKERIEFLRTKE
jgi:hypothetical protein